MTTMLPRSAQRAATCTAGQLRRSAQTALLGAAVAGPSRAPPLDPVQAFSTSVASRYPRQPAAPRPSSPPTSSQPSTLQQQAPRSVEEEQEALLSRLNIPSVDSAAVSSAAATSSSTSSAKPWFLEEEVIFGSEGVQEPAAGATTASTSSPLSAALLPPHTALPASLSDLLSSEHLGKHFGLVDPHVDVVHATSIDPDAWVEWIVLAEVKSGKKEDVARVALDVGEWLKFALAPADESQRRLEDLLGVEEALKRPREQTASRSEEPSSSHSRWTPKHILSREAIEGIRLLHAADPTEHSTKALAARFKVSYEAVARILKSRWTPDAKVAERQNRRAREREDEWRAQRAAQGPRGSEKEEEEELLRRFAEDAVDPEADADAQLADEQVTTPDERIPINRVEYEGLILPSELLARALDEGAAASSAAGKRAKKPKRSSSSRTSAQAANRGEGEWTMVKTDWCVVHVMTGRAKETWDVLRPWRGVESAI